MWDDASIQSWYGTPVGQKLVRKLLRQLRRWPALKWQGREPPAVLALGHAAVLEDLWPGSIWQPANNRGTSRFDRIVALHSTDLDEAPGETLAACWREVTPGGLVLLVLPNKWGLSRWSNKSPLGAGTGWRAGSLNKLIREAGFTTLDHETLLPGWPSGSTSLLPLPCLLRVMLLRKDEPAVTRLRLKTLRNPTGLAAAGQ